MNNKKTNTLSIIGFVVSIFSVIFGILLCVISLNQIKETKEKGKGLAISGIAINILKIISIILLFVLYIFSPTTVDENDYKCKHAINCDYHSESQTYTCTYNEDGVEEYITCESSDIKEESNSYNNDGTQDDPDNDDTFDYDAEY
ncbi:MAG: DUF4190 domain-containing protein [Erysipelotrichales bacterium]|nr:DUF4190 domain-containing protein [Erysipelotrichales bacterium]